MLQRQPGQAGPSSGDRGCHLRTWLLDSALRADAAEITGIHNQTEDLLLEILTLVV